MSVKQKDVGVLAGGTSPGNEPQSSSSSNHNTGEKQDPVKSSKPSSQGFLSKLGNLPEWSVRGDKLRGATLNYAIGFIASCGFLMFGYDQGVLSALLTLDSFQRDQPLMTPRDQSNPLCWLDFPKNNEPDPDMCTGDPNTQAAGVAIYQIGCFLGAVLILFYGEKWGRKSSTFWGSLIMIIGTIMQGGAMEYGLFVAGRVVGGVGNGMVTSSTFQHASSHAQPPSPG
jgi:hypothetical protein